MPADRTPMPASGRACVVRGDARQLGIGDNTVDLVVTSPPYWGLRSYSDAGEHYEGQIGDEREMTAYLDHLLTVMGELVRVLKPSGSIFVNLADKYAARRRGPNDSSSKLTNQSQHRPRGTAPRFTVPQRSLCALPQRFAIRCIDELGLILREDIVWSKPNGLPESVENRCRRTHEWLLHFVKAADYYAATDAIREPHAPGSAQRARAGYRDRRLTENVGAGHRRAAELEAGYDVNPLGRLPGSVWTIATQPLKVPASLGIDHFAAFPPELVRRVVLGWSPAAGTVLDPFGGTGTTALVAAAHGRRGISIDLSSDYCRLAAWRTTDRGEIARAMRVEKPPVEVTGQADLFGLVTPPQREQASA